MAEASHPLLERKIVGFVITSGTTASLLAGWLAGSSSPMRPLLIAVAAVVVALTSHNAIAFPPLRLPNILPHHFLQPC
ncbi:hypothetical protein Purlil1_12188 [Purpureocillium lilacinum]|uniref:Uncharacterized protein n=1 Tax=Purpureocillium lilacinum TaxID=33203 RepID=A0ABR0BHQ4_PURLI|nr:hypothetical protein Purlil1_12188 [Purpureocillium lilacinum]